MSKRALGVALLSALAACTRQPETLSGPSESNTSRVVDTGERPWRDSSESLSLQSYDFWDGQRTFEASRAELDREQLAALAELHVLSVLDAQMFEDVTTYSLSIDDRDGSVARYPTTVAGQPEESQATLSVDFLLLAPFLGGCLSARDTALGFVPAATGADAGAPAGASADAAAPASADAGVGRDAGVARDAGLADDAGLGDAGGAPAAAPRVSAAKVGCVHELTSPRQCGDVWLSLTIEEPGSYRIATRRCSVPVELALYAADDAALAAASGVAGECPAIEHGFEVAGAYPLRVRRSSAGDCASPDPTLGLQLRVSREASPP